MSTAPAPSDSARRRPSVRGGELAALRERRRSAARQRVPPAPAVPDSSTPAPAPPGSARRSAGRPPDPGRRGSRRARAGSSRARLADASPAERLRSAALHPRGRPRPGARSGPTQARPPEPAPRKPLLASEALMEDLAPVEPARRDAQRWCAGVGSGFLLIGTLPLLDAAPGRLRAAVPWVVTGPSPWSRPRPGSPTGCGRGDGRARRAHRRRRPPGQRRGPRAGRGRHGLGARPDGLRGRAGRGALLPGSLPRLRAAPACSWARPWCSACLS